MVVRLETSIDELSDLVLDKLWGRWVLSISYYYGILWVKHRFPHVKLNVNGKTKRRSAIIRNNRDFFLEHIQPHDEFIASLLPLNCITEEQSHFIKAQRSTRDKNDEILQIVRSFEETEFSDFVRCLRQTNQKMVARIAENGGGLKSNVISTIHLARFILHL